MVVGIDAHHLEGNPTGVGRYLFNILNAWEQSGALQEHRVILFFKDETPKSLPHGVEAKLLPQPLGISSTALFTHVLLPYAAAIEGVTVLFCPGYIAPLFTRIPVVLTLHDIVYEAHPEQFFWHSRADRILLKWVSKISARRAARVLAPSQFTASEIERCYDIPKQNIVITPEAADPIFSQPPKDTDHTIPATYGVEPPYLFFVGSMFSRRHIGECIDAFALLAKDSPNPSFLLAGKNYTQPFVAVDERIRAVNEALGREAIIHIPYIESEHLPALYRHAQATVWLSDYEGFGLPLIESLTCGTPVITSQSSCIPETVGECAILIEDNRNIQEIAQAMRRIFQDEALRDHLSSCGPLRAREFSWDRCASQTLEAIVAAAPNA